MAGRSLIDCCSPAQFEFVYDWKSLSLLYSGAIRSGKTEGLVAKGIASGFEWPGRKAVYARGRFSDLKDSTLATYFEVMERAGFYFDGPNKNAYANKTDHVYKWGPGWRNVDSFRGCERENLGRFKGMEIDLLLVDQAEELTEATWQFLEGRASGKTMPRSQLAAVCNPARQGKQHWLYQMFFVRKEGRAWQTKTTDNKFLPDDYVKHRLSRLKGRYHAMYVLGEWVGFEGLVYPDFDPLVHVIPRFDLTKDRDGEPVKLGEYSGLDYGYVNPAAHLTAAHDVKGVHGVEDALYVHRELYRTHLLAPDLAAAIKRHTLPRMIFADHAAQENAILRAHGVYATLAKKEIEPGIAAVTERLQPQMCADGIERPRLYFFDDMLLEPDPLLEGDADRRPTSTIGEFGLYQRPPAGTTKNVKEAPIDKDNHGMDALRYLVMGVASQGAGLPMSFRGGKKATARLPIG